MVVEVEGEGDREERKRDASTTCHKTSTVCIHAELILKGRQRKERQEREGRKREKKRMNSSTWTCTLWRPKAAQREMQTEIGYTQIKREMEGKRERLKAGRKLFPCGERRQALYSSRLREHT